MTSPTGTTRGIGPRWLVCRDRRPGAALRLYCFPHSGGSTGEYVRWADHLPDVEVWAVQAPGRGSRLTEAPYADLRSLVEAIVEEVDFRPPFAFFGHSLGALVAYETARALRVRGRARPAGLFVSAYPAPHLPRRRPDVHHLPDDVLLDAIASRYGHLPAEVLADPEYRQAIITSHRADFTIAETYRYADGPPLSSPLVVTAGADDAGERAELAAWRRHTTGPFSLHVLPGDHFYLREQRAALLGIISGTMARHLPDRAA